MEKGDDPYEILGVSYDASEEEIKKNYRKAALRYHPDRQETDEQKDDAHDIFSKIAAAYDTLTDPVKRYDWKQANEHKIKNASGGVPARAPMPAKRQPSSAASTTSYASSTPTTAQPARKTRPMNATRTAPPPQTASSGASTASTTTRPMNRPQRASSTGSAGNAGIRVNPPVQPAKPKRQSSVPGYTPNPQNRPTASTAKKRFSSVPPPTNGMPPWTRSPKAKPPKKKAVSPKRSSSTPAVSTTYRTTPGQREDPYSLQDPTPEPRKMEPSYRMGNNPPAKRTTPLSPKSKQAKMPVPPTSAKGTKEKVPKPPNFAYDYTRPLGGAAEDAGGQPPGPPSRPRRKPRSGLDSSTHSDGGSRRRRATVGLDDSNHSHSDSSASRLRKKRDPMDSSTHSEGPLPRRKPARGNDSLDSSVHSEGVLRPRRKSSRQDNSLDSSVHSEGALKPRRKGPRKNVGSLDSSTHSDRKFRTDASVATESSKTRRQKMMEESSTGSFRRPKPPPAANGRTARSQSFSPNPGRRRTIDQSQLPKRSSRKGKRSDLPQGMPLADDDASRVTRKTVKSKSGVHDPFQVFEHVMKEDFEEDYWEQDWKGKGFSLLGSKNKTIEAKAEFDPRDPKTVVSMSTSTKTEKNKDDKSKVDVKTITKVVRADGTVEKFRQASVVNKTVAKAMDTDRTVTISREKAMKKSNSARNLGGETARQKMMKKSKSERRFAK